MSLHIYNTLTRKKEKFSPRVAGQVSMYVCGPTVYNLAHIGNARPVVVFDLLFRLLQSQFDKVIYARNITDVDDKIIAAARERGCEISDVTDEFTKKYQEDMAALNTLTPTIVPYATRNIDAMIELVERLLEKEHAYASEGHVLFAVESMENYGELSNRSLDDMLAGARVDVASYKRHPGDFVLWKPAKDDEPGWDSPWGRGRPGWHLECSAMIRAHMGEGIDIHGGGVDLVFPHHENERAQSCCGYGGDFVRYWMHNAFLDMDGEKMSKSLGNVATVRDLLNSYRGEVLRFALISAHHRSPLDFSKNLLDQAEATLTGLYHSLREAPEVSDTDIEAVDLSAEPFYQALNDDLNTPIAIAELHGLFKAMNKATSDQERKIYTAKIRAAARLLGILEQSPEQWLQGGEPADGLSADDIEVLIAERVQAKLDKNYARADEIRNDLAAQGVVLEDSREGTKWHRE